MIISDNLAEIVMHDRTRYEFAREQSYPGFRPPKWSAKKRHAVMDNFDAKVNFLVTEIGTIDADDAAVLKFGHSVRNRAYHADVYHEDVIGEIARTYFGKLNRLYPKLRIPGVAYSRSQREADFLKRRGVSEPGELIRGGLARICAGLASTRDCPPADLASALSRNLIRRIEAIIGNSEEYGFLETLLNGNEGSDAEQDDMLKRIQFAPMSNGFRLRRSKH